MRKHKLQHGNHERWMVSYADFVTLLFAFFVVLYASAQVDKARMAKLSSAIREGFSDQATNPREGAPAGPASVVVPPAPQAPPGAAESAEQIRRHIESTLEVELRTQTIVLRDVPDGLVLSLHDVGFFESGAAQLRASSLASFDRIGTALAAVSSNLRVEGHTDNLPIHNSQFDSNWDLSTARATEIVRLLVTRENIDPVRLSAAGYAEFHPIAENTSEDGRRLNRRVDIVIVTPHEKPLTAATSPR